MAIGIGVGIPFNKGFSWSSYWTTHSEFWSDGSIIDGKLLNLKNDQTKAPSLIDSYCLVMAVNDTITFSSLAGWSIVSHGGTSVIVIEGNTIKCTTEGTLFNMILSDGSVNHIYPLAEGGYTIAFDTADVPSHGTIVCASLVWSTQSTYHKNVEGHNLRSNIDVFKQSVFVDSGNGVPVGWTDTYAKGGNSVTNGIFRKTKTEGMTSYGHFSIRKTGILTNGVSYYATIRIRAISAKNIQIRFGTVIKAITATTDWQTLTTVLTQADNTQLEVVCQTTSAVGDWFEFSYVLVELPVGVSYYIPKRALSDLDSQGNTITTLGNGYFIECETKLKFPDLAIYQTIDDHFGFLYDRLGNQEKLDWNDLSPNPYRMDKVFCTKTANRLTELICVNPANYTRQKFIDFLTYIGRSAYIYTKITKGAFVIFDYDTEHTYTQGNQRGALMNARGATLSSNMGESPSGWSALTISYVKAWIAAGNPLIARDHGYYGATSFECLTGEEAQFAAEIASGDLTIVDVPGGARGAIVKNTWPNFVTQGTLMNVAKTSGTVLIGDAILSGYANMFWIPAGSSGVPAAMCEKPMYRDLGGGTGKMYYYMWAADAFFEATFTNSDNIDVYVLAYEHYDFFSVAGMTCAFKHLRNKFESVDKKYKVSGSLESHGMMLNADIVSQAIYDAGMKFGTNGDLLYEHKTGMFSNQNTPRTWCSGFGHHYLKNISGGDVFATILTWIPDLANRNVIIDSELETEWGIDLDIPAFQSLLDACDAVGMLIMSPLDLIKNLQFNDYDGDDFWLP